MLALNFNNFGGGIVTLKDYQSKGLCVLNGKIIVDPSLPAYITANRLELDLPSDFKMCKSAMSTAILVSNAPLYRDGTILHCWIENNKLCIEKVTLWDSYGNYEIHINSAFVTRGYRGGFSSISNSRPSIINPPDQFSFGSRVYLETDDYVYFSAIFFSFPYNLNDGQGPFTMQLSGIATDFNVEIPIIVTDYNSRFMTGSKLVVGTFENGKLIFNYQQDTSPMGGGDAFFNFFAVRDKTNSI